MKYFKILVYVLLCSIFISCLNDEIVKPPKKLAVIYKRSINDTIFIFDQHKIESIISLLNDSKIQPAKMNTNIWISYIDNGSIIKIGINSNRFKFKGKQYVSQKNLESKIENIIGSN